MKKNCSKVITTNSKKVQKLPKISPKCLLNCLPEVFVRRGRRQRHRRRHREDRRRRHEQVPISEVHRYTAFMTPIVLRNDALSSSSSSFTPFSVIRNIRQKIDPRPGRPRYVAAAGTAHEDDHYYMSVRQFVEVGCRDRRVASKLAAPPTSATTAISGNRRA